jgi:hypothetical protein
LQTIGLGWLQKVTLLISVFWVGMSHWHLAKSQSFGVICFIGEAPWLSLLWCLGPCPSSDFQVAWMRDRQFSTIFFLWDKVSPCSWGWPQIPSPPASVSCVLVL